MKKKLHLIYFILFVLISFNCSRKILLPTSAEVNYISGKEGTVTVRAIGIGNNEGEAITNAIYNAFDVLLFRGLPESEQKVALIGTNENEERNKQKTYFDQFYSGRYKSFVMSSIPSSNLINYTGGKKGIAVDIKINLVALRKDLEQNNIIRAFGF